MKRRDFIKAGTVAGLATTVGATFGPFAFASTSEQKAPWWKGRAIRWLQTNLREPDAASKPN
jgi:anaerobic selenocysteine-containing dehydrogenase